MTSLSVKRNLELTPKLAEMGFIEIYSIGKNLILSTNTYEIQCKLDYNDLTKTGKYANNSLSKFKEFTVQDKEIICTEIAKILLDSLKQQCDELQNDKQKEQQTTNKILNEINQLREHNTNLTPEEWQYKLRERYSNLYDVIQKTIPEIWSGLEFELSIMRVLDLEDCTLPFIGIILGRPSSYKTVIISLLKDWHKTFYTDIFTARSFVSHSTSVETEEELQQIDMLPKIRDKMFLTPELSPLFTSKEEDLIQLLGIITRIADGHGLSIDSGAHGHRGYDGKYMFTWTGAAVDIPYKVYKILGNLGAKLYFYRMEFEEQTPEQLEKYAIEDEDFNAKVLLVKDALYDYLKWFETSPILTPKIKWDFAADSKEALKYIAGMADLLSFLRCIAKVWETHDSQGSEYAYSISQREKPHRAITHLKSLARGHALLEGRNHITIDDIRLIMKTALDSAQIERVSIFSLLIAHNGKLTDDDILQSMNVSRPTALRTMAEFKAISLVTIENDKKDSPGRPPKLMVLNPRFNWFLEDELIKEIIPHTTTNLADITTAGNIDDMAKEYIIIGVFDELQKEEAASNIAEADKLTVNRRKLEQRLIGTGQFYNGDATRLVTQMLEGGKLKEVMQDTLMKV